MPLTVTVTLTDEALAAGWGGDRAEAAASVAAAVREVIGDDGMPYVPTAYPVTPEAVAYVAALVEVDDGEHAAAEVAAEVAALFTA